MSRRGPYKRYEHDPNVSLPKRTFYRRKRHHKEIEATTNAANDSGNECNVRYGESVSSEEEPHAAEENIADEYFQVRDPTDDEASDCDTNNMHGHDKQNYENDNEPIYPGAEVTKTESLLLIMCFVLRHKLTDVALGDLLLLLNTFFPNVVPATKYLFYKLFKLEQSEKHFYCSACSSYLGKETTLAACELCDNPFNEGDSLKNGHYFIYIPLQQQIMTMLSNAKLYSHLTNRNLAMSINSRNVTDVTTSALYKELITKQGLNSNDMSLTWNTDGIPVFNSSNFSIWPLQAFVNELPPHLRARNILLLGLWFGKKPCMNVFLKPFVEECRKLERDGFVFGNEAQPRRVFSPLLSADAPARAIVRNVKQFDGEHGCDWCEFPGVAVGNNNGPPNRYYPHSTPVIMRSARKQAEYALQATKANPIKGVKGMTVADVIPSFDPVRGTVTDYMHSVCQGVMRQMMGLWVDSKHHGEAFYIGSKVKLIDERLQQISPPSEIHRSPRSLSERCYWKASEWRAFIFYSLIVLQGILPRNYLQHFFLFVYGIYTLLGDSISNSAINLSELCLTKFVVQMEDLYGLSQCKYNVHCLTHLAHCVRDCGPLWASYFCIHL